MDVLELGAFGELVGGVAVIAPLVFVGLQVRQGKRLARAQVHQEAARTCGMETPEPVARP